MNDRADQAKEYKFKNWELRQKQSLPLEQKVVYSVQRIRDWYEHWQGDVYVAFSGGKDSLVLLDIVRSVYPDVPAVFVDTGVEWPEIREYVRSVESVYPNIIWIKPDISFPNVLKTYGYPVISKQIAKRLNCVRHPTGNNDATVRLYTEGIRSDGTKAKRFMIPKTWQFLKDAPFEVSDRCCHELKKAPAAKYTRETGRHAMVGNTADESSLRKIIYYKEGCNRFTGRDPISRPLSIWTEKDIWDYIKLKKLPYCKIYDMGMERTGCMYCLFGIHVEKNSRFEWMKEHHPKNYDFCMNGLGYDRILEYIRSKGLNRPVNISIDDDTGR